MAGLAPPFLSITAHDRTFLQMDTRLWGDMTPEARRNILGSAVEAALDNAARSPYRGPNNYYISLRVEWC